MSQVVRFNDVVKLNKKELIQLGASHAQEILNEGFEDATVLTVQAKKAREYIQAFLDGLEYKTREQLTQDPNGWEDIYGASLSLGSTGDRLAYLTDPKYSQLSIALKQRKEILDLAFRSDEMFDSDGELVPKIKIKTHSKETLIVKL